VAPLTPERYRFAFCRGKATHDKLRRAQDLLCREVPNGDVGEIFDRALDSLIAHLEKKKRSATKSPRPPRPVKVGARRAAANVARAVWARDGERCAYVGPDGRRCTETRFLELHHVDPYALDGPTTVTNVSVRCQAHNRYESELVFGPFVPVVRETAEKYVVSGRTGAVPGRRGATARPTQARPTQANLLPP
jgi:hypothetical protein